ncbi:MAG: hypothetical protein AAF974_09605 [Cyanobacteria bacterium P01_E01_bin.34]
MPQLLMMVDPHERASRLHISPRTTLVSLASAALLVSVGLSSSYAAAQEEHEGLEGQQLAPSPAINRVLSEPDSTVGEQRAPEPQGEGPNNPALPLAELDLDRIPYPHEITSPLTVDLSQLVLIPSPATVSWLDEQFEVEIAPINSRIAFRQDLLQQLLSNPDSSDNRIRQVQSILSQLRAERDRIALEHLLLVRQVNENGALPTQTTNSALE